MYTMKRFLGFKAQMCGGVGTLKDMTVFQTPEIQKYYFNKVWIYGILKRSIPVTYAVYDDHKLVFVFPAWEDKHNIELAGSTNGICILSPFYYGPSYKYRDILIYFLKNVMQHKCIIINRLMKCSETASIITDVFNDELAILEYGSVKIPISNGYELWFSGLSKSVRQNIRTAYNRCAKDGLLFEFKVINGGDISDEMMGKLMALYNNRHIERYGLNVSIAKKLYLRYADFSTLSLKSNSNARHCILLINGELAGFFSGYYDKTRKNIIIPRLSINSKFKRLSPGYMLINEAVKYYDNNSEVYYIDLAEGTEKYKIDLGGEVYKQGRYIIG